MMPSTWLSGGGAPATTAVKEENSDSDDYTETLTIAYTESVVTAESSLTEESSTLSVVSSSTLETPRSQESATSLLEALDKRKEKDEFLGYEPVWRTMSMSEGPTLHALEYFYKHSIYQLFTFLMSHLLAATPEEPVAFLVTLVDRCLLHRQHRPLQQEKERSQRSDSDRERQPENGSNSQQDSRSFQESRKELHSINKGDHLHQDVPEPPLLFQDAHVLSVYTALDPAGDGSITYRQYLNGMSTLGLTDFNILPGGSNTRIRDISKKVFLSEARKALITQLDRLLGPLPHRHPSFTSPPQEREYFPSVVENVLQSRRVNGQPDRASYEEEEIVYVLHDDFATPQHTASSHAVAIQKRDAPTSQHKTTSRVNFQEDDSTTSQHKTASRMSIQKDNSTTFQYKTTSWMSIQKDDSITSQHKTTSRMSIQKDDSTTSQHKTASRMSIQKDDLTTSQLKPPSIMSIQKHDSTTPQHKTASRMSIQKHDSPTSQHKTASRMSIQKDDSTPSQHKTASRMSIQKDDSTTSQHKTASRMTIQKDDSNTYQHKTASRMSIQKEDSTTSQHKTT